MLDQSPSGACEMKPSYLKNIRMLAGQQYMGSLDADFQLAIRLFLLPRRNDGVFLGRNFNPVHTDDLELRHRSPAGLNKWKDLGVNHEAQRISNIALEGSDWRFCREKLIAAFISFESAWISKYQCDRILN